MVKDFPLLLPQFAFFGSLQAMNRTKVRFSLSFTHSPYHVITKASLMTEMIQ